MGFHFCEGATAGPAACGRSSHPTVAPADDEHAEERREHDDPARARARGYGLVPPPTCGILTQPSVCVIERPHPSMTGMSCPGVPGGSEACADEHFTVHGATVNPGTRVAQPSCAE